MRCAQESRRLVEQQRAQMARSVNLDKLDNYNEVNLGLVVTFAVTALIWVIALPFFYLVGTAWIRSWEFNGVDKEPLELPEFRSVLLARYNTSQLAFQVMDQDHDDEVTISEFSQVVFALNATWNATQVDYAFRGLDEDQDDLLNQNEFVYALSRRRFFRRPPLELTAAATTSSLSSATSSTPTSSSPSTGKTTSSSQASSGPSTSSSGTSSPTERNRDLPS